MKLQSETFTNRDPRPMILPLFVEQQLVMLVGMADTLVVSYAGKAAVSGAASSSSCASSQANGKTFRSSRPERIYFRRDST